MRKPLIAGITVGLGLWLAPIASAAPLPPEPPDPCSKGMCQPPGDRNPQDSGVRVPDPPPSRLPQHGGDASDPNPGIGAGGSAPGPGGEQHKDPDHTKPPPPPNSNQ
jgi:hypothetical protein